MAYVRNRPVATELLSDSQPFLFNEFNSADDSFGVDHYMFSDITANNGFHNTVTQPIIGIVPPAIAPAHPTTTTNPIIYAMQDLATFGVIQYSRGPVFNSYVPSPTPITNLYSPSTPIVLNPGSPTTNILDLTGLNQLMARLTMTNYGSSSQIMMTVSVYYELNGITPIFKFITSYTSPSTPSQLFPTSSGKILQISTAGGVTFNNIFWSLELIRINE